MRIINTTKKILYYSYITCCFIILASCSASNSNTESPISTGTTTTNIIEQRIQAADEPELVTDTVIEQDTQAIISQPDPESFIQLPKEKGATLDDLLKKLPNRLAAQDGNAATVDSPFDETGQYQYDKNQQRSFETVRQRLLQLLQNNNNTSDADIIRQQLAQGNLYGIIQPIDSEITPGNAGEELAEDALNQQQTFLDTPIFNEDEFNNAAKRAAQLLLQGSDIISDETEETIDNSNNTNQQTPAASAANTAKRIALLVPLSGKYGNIGNAVLQAAQMALQQSKNKNISLLPLDTKGTTMGAANAANAALQKGASIIIGPLFAENTRAISAIVAPYSIPIFSLSNDAQLANGQIFTFGLNPVTQIDYLFKYFTQYNINKLGLFLPNTSYGNFITKVAQQKAPQFDITINANAQYDYSSSNFSGTIIAMSNYAAREEQSLQGQRATPPKYQALLLSEVDENNLRALAAQLDYFDSAAPNVVLAGLEPWGNLDNLAQEKSLWGAIFVGLDRESRAIFDKNYIRTFKKEPHAMASIAFDVSALAIYLLQKETSIQQLLTNPSISFKGVDGKMFIAPDGRVERQYHMYQITQDGITLLQ